MKNLTETKETEEHREEHRLERLIRDEEDTISILNQKKLDLDNMIQKSETNIEEYTNKLNELNHEW